MGYIVANRLEVSLFIGDKEYPLGLGQGNVLNFFHIAASTKFRLPSVCFSVLDVTHALDKLTPQDGIPLRIAIKANESQTRTYTFRKFNSRRVLTGDAWDYTIDGYWDAPRFWNGTAVNGIQGTSDEALASIAKDCGLKYDGTSTADSMLWMPANKKMHEFVSHISNSAYADPTSLMKWGVDLDGTLRYRNVNNLPDKNKPKQLVAYQKVKGAYTVVDYQPSSKSGFTNASTGYMNTRYLQSAIGDQFSVIEDSIVVTSDSRAPDYNTKVRDLTTRGKVSHSPINFGNTHPQYSRARYQNNRYSALYSMNLEFLINEDTNLQLFDTINFTTETEQQKEDRLYSGIYIVTGRVLYAKGATYAEKIYGTRMGLNSEYNPQ